MPARNFPIIVIQLKFNQKLCHLSRHAPPDASLFCHAMPKIKDDKSEGKVMEIGAIICQRQGPQPTTAQTHTQTYTHTHTHTHVAQLAVRCSQGLHCNKNHRTTGKNGGETDTKKKK